MAILWTDDLIGTPTSGLPSTANHPWAESFNGSCAYTADTVNGQRALTFGGAYGDARVDVEGISSWRLRFVAERKSGTQSGHHFLTRLGDDTEYIWGDSQIRNVAGPPVWNRWNFVNGGATGAWGVGEPWRFEYRYEVGVGTLLEVWTDPDDSGEPDYAISASGSPTSPILFLAFGNANTTSGLVVLFSALAMSEGERIGPWTPPEPSGGKSVRGVIVDGEIVEANLRGVIKEGNLVPANLR